MLCAACLSVGERTVAPIPASSTTVPEALAGFPTTQIEIGDHRLDVAVADTPARRAQGLMGVEALGDLDGMLFVFPSQGTYSFWMKDTLIPLDLAFFDQSGLLLGVLAMEPCQADPCPSYRPPQPFRWALEAPAGDLAVLPSEARLNLDVAEGP